MKYIYLFLISLLFVACEDNLEDYKLDLPELSFSDVAINCYPSTQGTVIDSDAAYQTFQDEENDDVFCGDTEYPTIDFSNQTLLGIQRSVGCNIGNRYWNVYIDEAEKEYIFQTITEGEGNCLSLALDRYWVMVPKLPSDYTVRFVEYER